MVSPTTSACTSIQNVNYMYVIAHYIDEAFRLRKKIFNFFIANHKGETIGITLENCLKEWGIEKLCCVIVDNASANNVVISYLSTGLSV